MRRLPLSVRQLGERILGAVSVRVRGGPNAGRRWSLVSSGRGYVSGTFEADRVTAITALLRPGDTFWDIGAHKGYISLAAARAVGPAGRVIALEPATLNRIVLERHVAWNGAHNIRIVPVAVSDSVGQDRFGGSGSTVTFHLGHGDEMVATRTIASLIESERLPPPDVLKIDAEGSEARILRGGLDYLTPVMLIWISVHSRPLFDECTALLQHRNFRIVQSVSMKRSTSGPPEHWGGDQELLALGSARGVSDAELNALRLFRA